MSEIFPTRLREPGIAIGVASQWLFSFIYTLTNPYMVANLKYGTLFFWGAANLCIAVISYFLIRETQGLSLEEINAVCDCFLYVSASVMGDVLTLAVICSNSMAPMRSWLRSSGVKRARQDQEGWAWSMRLRIKARPETDVGVLEVQRERNEFEEIIVRLCFLMFTLRCTCLWAVGCATLCRPVL